MKKFWLVALPVCCLVAVEVVGTLLSAKPAKADSYSPTMDGSVIYVQEWADGGTIPFVSTQERGPSAHFLFYLGADGKELFYIDDHNKYHIDPGVTAEDIARAAVYQGFTWGQMASRWQRESDRAWGAYEKCQHQLHRRRLP